MKEVCILFPHQLFTLDALPSRNLPVYLVEEFLFFQQYSFHKQKIAFHRASMKSYAETLQAQNVEVRYIDAQDDRSDVRWLMAHLGAQGITAIHFIDPVDDWLTKRVIRSGKKNNIQIHRIESPLFLNTPAELAAFFDPKKDKYFQTSFYISERKKRSILINPDGNPAGGQWSFDGDNRKKYPRDQRPPQIKPPESNQHWQEALHYVTKNYASNYGNLSREPLYPYDHHMAKRWLEEFIESRFKDFGPYEDAILKDHPVLHHSVLTPLLNVGLISPQQVLDAVLSTASKHQVPLNSLEGFIRQVIGWREFIRGIYITKGVVERTKNFWGFTRKMPASFYDGTTGIDPVDHTIRQVLQSGYAHHIERLMVLGNFMLLCELDPDEVYRWFMELFIDAYDWVMVPNVYGMSQYADGGLMATKPYISGSNYILKMSDYQKGSWQAVWDGLFWRFIHVHRSFFDHNPRLSMLLRTWDRMDAHRKTAHLKNAENYLHTLH